MMFGAPSTLSKLEFASIRFILEFQEAIDFGMERMLRLRRDLRASARHFLLEEYGLDRGEEVFEKLFEPPLPEDPIAVRRIQRPGPAFVIQIDPGEGGEFQAGDHLVLHIHFWGKASVHVLDFARVLQTLGPRGLHHGEGKFELIEILGLDAGGGEVSHWRLGQVLDHLAPSLIPLDWWLERLSPLPGARTLHFVTPARLLSRGRPLFQPTFNNLFPFILRRVTSMMYAHCGLEIIDDPKTVREMAENIEEVKNTLSWKDWRVLIGEDRSQELGGICGFLKLTGPGVEEIDWLLQLGSLLNLGKGASFGAGFYRVVIE